MTRAIPKSTTCGSPNRPEQHVRGFDVEVQHPGVVRCRERVGERGADGQRLGWGHRVAVDTVGQRAAGQERHEQIGRSGIGRPGVEHRHDAGVLRHRPEHPALAFELLEPRRVDERGVEHLDGDIPVEPLLAGSVHDAEPAAADLGQIVQTVDAERRCHMSPLWPIAVELVPTVR